MSSLSCDLCRQPFKEPRTWIYQVHQVSMGGAPMAPGHMHTNDDQPLCDAGILAQQLRRAVRNGDTP